ncbi:pentatricopeptide repeat-containing protein At2g06000-like [Cynara cardunculus var. scolymus]|uniref:Pentatricopeptide repeat-containing protein n=1 Tax=Cynara cardunculus var. scolymus TaxID=59895 RepID=A0A103YEV6_CYNCS|nr:pentatricopeptide repeat-containing protein At2g06000-like [Cynara cardunculus var. scolymus]KVI07821.1 Pentatricopeptide repeat-containing protein [Cynara cardunculus var. scolymus]
MPLSLRWSNHPPRTHNFPFCLFSFSKLQRVSKTSSISKSEGQFGGASSVWFVKVVCTLYVRRKSSVKEVRVSDYLRKNLNSLTAFSVIKHMNSNWNNPNLAFSFLEYTKNTLNLVHSTETYSFLLRSFGYVTQVGVHDLAKKVIDLMRIDEVLPDSSLLGFVITSFVNAGKFEVAKELMVDHSRSSVEKDEVLSCVVFNKLLSSLVKSNHMDEAVSFFENIILRLKCYSPDACTFNIVISALCRAREVDKAFSIFNKMRKFGCFPDLVTYNTLLNGFCRAGNVDKAHELLRETCMVDGCSPNVVTFTSVISGYCKLGKMEEAMVLFDNMIGHGIRPNTVTFNVIIDGFGKIGNMVSVLNMYEKMVDLGCTPDVITFTSIIDGHCRLGELQQGLKIWDEMNRRNLYPNIYTFSILINTLCEKGRLNEACDLLRQLKKRDDIVPKTFVYIPVIDGFCKAGNVDKANAIVKEMEEKRCKPDKVTFTILIIGHCMKGRMIEAISLFQKMLVVGCVPDSVTVNSLVSRLLKAGMPKDAFEITKAASGMPVTQTDTSYSKNTNIPVAF